MTERDTIVNAIEENLYDYIRLFAPHKENDFYEDETVLRFISGINIPSMQSNSIYKNRFPESGTIDETIKSMVGLYKKKKAPFFCTLGPSSRPDNLAACFEKYGLSHVQSQKGMAFDLEKMNLDSVETGAVTIKKIRSEEELEQFLKIYTIGFDYSSALADYIFKTHRDVFFSTTIPASHYIAFVKGKPVGTSSLFVTGEIAGLYNIITIPEARRRGIAELLTLVPMIEGKKMGCKTAILQATEMGAHVYKKIGFHEYCDFDLYMKLNGSSTITYPAAYIGKKISNYFRKFRSI
ncbi:MAG: GNAT family N-acetyltransferase [bacterium]|nr:GNAT family N-acetyltransferase [bacterium]